MADQYFVRATGGPEAGPMGADNVRALVRSGELSGSDLIRKETSASWMTILSIPQLAADLPKLPAPPLDELGMHEVAPPPRAGSNAPLAGPADAEANKAMAIIGYIFPFLFFIPLVTDAKTSPFARFHANQQLVYFIFSYSAAFVSAILMIVLIGYCLFPLVALANLTLMILGIVNAANNRMAPLPVIGGIRIINTN